MSGVFHLSSERMMPLRMHRLKSIEMTSWTISCGFRTHPQTFPGEHWIQKMNQNRKNAATYFQGDGEIGTATVEKQKEKPSHLWGHGRHVCIGWPIFGTLHTHTVKKMRRRRRRRRTKHIKNWISVAMEAIKAWTVLDGTMLHRTCPWKLRFINFCNRHRLWTRPTHATIKK